jgi:CheY-like chemotaxis protein
VSQPNIVIDIGYRAPDLKKVLVVDDETALQTLIHDTLEGDYRLASAYNGREGIEMAVHMKPDVILMDVMMPDVGGYEAVLQLQSDERTKDIPVIVMTAKNFDDLMIREIKSQSNVAGFLTKPFRPKGLREAVKAAIERRKS